MKQPLNFWPLAIIVTFVLFISGTISLVVMACSQKTDLVSSDYYEQEIKFQRHLDQLEHTRTWAKDASVTYDSSTRHIRISLPKRQALSLSHEGEGRGEGEQRRPTESPQLTGHIQLYRPSAAGLDRRLKLETDSEGVQYLDTYSLQRGLWKVRVSWNANGTEYFLDRSLLIGG